MKRRAFIVGLGSAARNGGAAGSVTGGNGKFFEQPGGTRS